MPKVVFDTQVYLRALINSRSVCGRLLFEWDQHYQLYVCNEIETEIIDVLGRSKIRTKFPQITDDIGNFLEKSHISKIHFEGQD